MAILETMFYECKVVAWNALGLNYIIEFGKTGWLADSSDGIINSILIGGDVGRESHCRVLNEFTWKSSASKMNKIVNRGC